MKRILYIFLVLSIVAIGLSSCLVVPQGDEITDVKVYGDGQVTLLRGMDLGSTDSKAALSTLGGAFEKLSIVTTQTTDSYKKQGAEIVVGDSYREVSQKAREYLSSNAVLGGDSDKDAIIVFAYGDSIAITATSDRAVPAAVDYFIKTYMTASSLTVKSNLADMQYISYSAYLAELEDEAWEHRFDKAHEIMGDEAATALEQLYDYYGTEFCEWLAGLYDPEIGAFYYSASARDNYPFLPDIESTAQALGMFRFSKIMGSGTSVELFKQFPEDIRRGFYEFAESLRAEDGYFYHPQWGTGIGAARKGRDYDQANSVLSWFADVKGTSAAVSRLVDSRVKAVATPNLPEWMTSFTTGDTTKTDAYLESLKVHQDSHSAGHTLSSQTSQIKMVPGLYDYILDYLDAKQEEIQAALRADGKPENGLWEMEANYRSLSGLIKIGSFYGSRQINYSDKMLDGAIEVILSNKKSEAELHQIVYIFNPWGGLSVCVNNQLSANKAARDAGLPEPNDMNATYGKIYDAFPEMVSMTIEKLRLFRQEQGSYSYYQSGSAPTTQGVYVSLGVPEGDVNGTICAIQYTLSAIFESIGVPEIPMCRKSQFADVLKIMTEAGQVVKNPPADKTEHTFDGEDLNYLIDASGAVWEIKNDPYRADNTVLSITDTVGAYRQLVINADYGLGTEKCFVFESEMCFVPGSFASREENPQTMTHQISLQTANKTAYMLYLDVKGDRIYLNDNSNASTMSAATGTNLTFVAEQGEWFTLRVEYYPMEDGTMKAKIFKNEQLLAISDNHYEKDKGASAPSTIKKVSIACMTHVASELLLDNVMNYADNTEFGGTAPTEAETVFDFDNGKQPAYVTSSAGTTAIENGELTFSSEAGVLGNALYFYPSSYLSSVTQFVFEADMMIGEESDNGITHQIFFRKGNANGYLMVIRVMNGKVHIEDHSTDGANPVVVISEAVADVGEYFTLRVESYPIYEEDEDTGAPVLSTVKYHIYVDDEFIGESENCYVKSSGTVVKNGIVDNVYILALRAPKSALSFDSVSMFYTQEVEYEEVD